MSNYVPWPTWSHGTTEDEAAWGDESMGWLNPRLQAQKHMNAVAH